MSALTKAIELHQSGRLAEAERAYRQILDDEPDNADALQLLGVIAKPASRRPSWTWRARSGSLASAP